MLNGCDLMCFCRIENLEQSNEGVYICRASSSFGQAQDTARLTIQGALPTSNANSCGSSRSRGRRFATAPHRRAAPSASPSANPVFCFSAAALPKVMINVRTSVQTVMIGNSVEFECQALGEPEPTVQWSKVGGSLPAHIMVKGGMLRIEQVTEADAGQYRCTATNDVGSVQSQVVLNVQCESATPSLSTSIFRAAGLEFPPFLFPQLCLKFPRCRRRRK